MPTPLPPGSILGHDLLRVVRGGDTFEPSAGSAGGIYTRTSLIDGGWALLEGQCVVCGSVKVDRYASVLVAAEQFVELIGRFERDIVRRLGDNRHKSNVCKEYLRFRYP